MKIANKDIDFEFFIIEKGKVPILLGNDIMEVLGGKINISEKVLDFDKLKAKVRLVRTPSGHLVIPIGSIAQIKEDEGAPNVKDEEAHSVMLALLMNAETDNDVAHLHDQVGHTAFVSLSLNDEEKNKVIKVNKYFGHR